MENHHVLTGNSALLSSFIIYDITIYNTHIDGLFSIAVLFFLEVIPHSKQFMGGVFSGKLS